MDNLTGKECAHEGVNWVVEELRTPEGQQAIISMLPKDYNFENAEIVISEVANYVELMAKYLKEELG